MVLLYSETLLDTSVSYRTDFIRDMRFLADLISSAQEGNPSAEEALCRFVMGEQEITYTNGVQNRSRICCAVRCFFSRVPAQRNFIFEHLCHLYASFPLSVYNSLVPVEERIVSHPTLLGAVPPAIAVGTAGYYTDTHGDTLTDEACDALIARTYRQSREITTYGLSGKGKEKLRRVLAARRHRQQLAYALPGKARDAEQTNDLLFTLTPEDVEDVSPDEETERRKNLLRHFDRLSYRAKCRVSMTHFNDLVEHPEHYFYRLDTRSREAKVTALVSAAYEVMARLYHAYRHFGPFNVFCFSMRSTLTRMKARLREDFFVSRDAMEKKLAGEPVPLTFDVGACLYRLDMKITDPAEIYDGLIDYLDRRQPSEERNRYATLLAMSSIRNII